jgi:very-short-patch-repair endonuclease
MTRIADHMRSRARDLRANMTPQERRVWAQLRDLNRTLGTNFRRQAPVGRYIAGFADFSRRVVIEIDGGGHDGPGDQSRDEWFAGQGFAVLRFWNAEVDRNLEGIMQVVLDGLESPPPPSPPHKGEGGQESTPVAPIVGGDLA